MTDAPTVRATRKLLHERQWIIHAAGFLSDSDGNPVAYTNSLDALLNCAKKGNSISEIDFRISTDGFLVCTHEWNQALHDGIPLSRAVSKDEFLACDIDGRYTTMWLGDLVHFLESNPDFYFVTDIKDDNVEGCRLIAEYAPEWKDHFIIQIYHGTEYEPIRRMGFRNIIFTLYASRSEERKIRYLTNFARWHPIVGFTYWAQFADDYLPSLQKWGIPLYVHTVNDRDKRDAYLKQGVSAVYTDVVDNDK